MFGHYTIAKQGDQIKITMRAGAAPATVTIPADITSDDPGPWVGDRIRAPYSLRKATLKTDFDEYQLMSFFPRLPRALMRRLSEELRVTAANTGGRPGEEVASPPSVGGASAAASVAAGARSALGRPPPRSGGMRTPPPVPPAIVSPEGLFGEDEQEAEAHGEEAAAKADGADPDLEEDVPSPTT